MIPRAPTEARRFLVLAFLATSSMACEQGRGRAFAPPGSGGAAAPRGVLVTSAETPAPPRAASSPPETKLLPLPARDLCITSGGGAVLSPLRYGVDRPSTRGFVTRPETDDVELVFTYHGATATQLPLASGEMRKAVGLKLRAVDSCNVLYVMWRVEPSPGVYVSVKHNPGMVSHVQCRDGGYHGMQPSLRPGETLAKPPLLEVGTTHALRAVIAAERLRVWADGALAWAGELPPEARALRGPAGFRSDDVRVDLEMRVPEAALRAPASVCDP